MANRFMDSCDHYAAGDILTKYGAIGATAPTITTGRSVNGLSMNGSGTASYALCVLDAQTVWYVGFAFKPSSAGSIVSVWSSGSFQIGVKLNTDGTLQFHNDSLTGLGAATSVTVAAGNWYYLEVKFTVASSTAASGDCAIRLNSTNVLNLASGIRTNYANGTTANAVCFGQWTWFRFDQNYSGVFDDIYINDSTGTADNTYWGDITVDALFTNVAGTYQDFSLTGAASSVLATTDRAPDGDSTYVYSNTLTNRESFTYTTPSFSILTVYGVQLLSYAKKVGSGTRNLTPFTRSGITNYEQTAVAIGTSYSYSRSPMRLNPATGLAWTESDILAIEAGVKVS